MLIDLLSQSNYQSFNVNLAHMLGLHNAIYLGLLIELNEKAIRKNKTIDSTYFVIDREYVKNRTTLEISEQMKAEDILVDMGILDRHDLNVKVNLNVVTELLITADETINADLDRIKKAANKSSKGDYVLRSVKSNIDNSYPNELRTAYCEWLDIINRKFNFVSNQLLFQAEKVVDEYANHDLDKALQVLKIAQANGWKDVSYAIKKHKESTNNIKAHKNKDIKVMSGVEF